MAGNIYMAHIIKVFLSFFLFLVVTSGGKTHYHPYLSGYMRKCGNDKVCEGYCSFPQKGLCIARFCKCVS
ncbi:hypothetical protein P8452_56461 [Trifolium repens]|nr:hypothetical protein P8452_56461 [Trifolium repens]